MSALYVHCKKENYDHLEKDFCSWHCTAKCNIRTPLFICEPRNTAHTSEDSLNFSMFSCVWVSKHMEIWQFSEILFISLWFDWMTVHKPADAYWKQKWQEQKSLQSGRFYQSAGKESCLQDVVGLLFYIIEEYSELKSYPRHKSCFIFLEWIVSCRKIISHDCKVKFCLLN